MTGFLKPCIVLSGRALMCEKNKYYNHSIILTAHWFNFGKLLRLVRVINTIEREKKERILFNKSLLRKLTF